MYDSSEDEGYNLEYRVTIHEHTQIKNSVQIRNVNQWELDLQQQNMDENNSSLGNNAYIKCALPFISPEVVLDIINALY